MADYTKQQLTAALTSELGQLFAGNSEPAAHPFDDIKLLVKLEEGAATEAEWGGLQQHLSRCADCRERFLLLREHGTLFDSYIPQEVTADTKPKTAYSKTKRNIRAALITCAASLLICIGAFGTLESPVPEYEGSKSFSLEPAVEKSVNNTPNYIVGTLAGIISAIALLYSYREQRKDIQ
ncbi:hypothetical protein FACS1894189_3180 [Planctomycetales bacterium]|nr:hypothetical protein FACS1894189_3180 [Planctomycetales bacterium]